MQAYPSVLCSLSSGAGSLAQSVQADHAAGSAGPGPVHSHHSMYSVTSLSPFYQFMYSAISPPPLYAHSHHSMYSTISLSPLCYNFGQMFNIQRLPRALERESENSRGVKTSQGLYTVYLVSVYSFIQISMYPLNFPHLCYFILTVC